MAEETPPTDRPDLTGEWDETSENLSVRDRVYEVAIQLYEPTRVKAVAERADCAKETARDYLRWFVEAGILVKRGSDPELYERNDSYFEWKRAFELQQRSRDELAAELAELTERAEALSDRYEADEPGEVVATEHGDDSELEAIWDDLREWEAIREQIRLIDQARRMQSESEAPA